MAHRWTRKSCPAFQRRASPQRISGSLSVLCARTVGGSGRRWICDQSAAMQILTISRGVGPKCSPRPIWRNIVRSIAALRARTLSQAVSLPAIQTPLDNLTAHQPANRREAAIKTQISLPADGPRVHDDRCAFRECHAAFATVGVCARLRNPHPHLIAGPQVRIRAVCSSSRSCCFGALAKLRSHQEPGVGRLPHHRRRPHFSFQRNTSHRKGRRCRQSGLRDLSLRTMSAFDRRLDVGASRPVDAIPSQIRARHEDVSCSLRCRAASKACRVASVRFGARHKTLNPRS